MGILAIDAGLMIELILYIALIIVTILLVFITSFKTKDFNQRLLGIISILIAIVYLVNILSPIIDGNVRVNPMTFTIGTVLCPLILISRYVKPFDKIKPTVALISAVSIIVYSIYFVRPESFYTLSPERIIQIYLYYGLLFIYGILSITTLDVEINIKKSYRELLAISLMEGFAFIIRMIISPLERIREGINVRTVFASSPVIIVVSYLGVLFIYFLNYLYQKIKTRSK